MMVKFNKLNQEYNKIAEGEFSKDIVVNNEDVLNFDEENVFIMIKKAKQDIKTISENNNQLNKQIKDCEECISECTNIIETIKTF